MPVEGSVAAIEDLNPLWPLSEDPKDEGDNHIRNIKEAILSIVSNIQQVGFYEIEQLLNSTTTEITYGGKVNRGSIITVKIRQDATGGRLITWDPEVFRGAGTDISLAPNSYSVFMFCGDPDGLLFLCANPLLGASL